MDDVNTQTPVNPHHEFVLNQLEHLLTRGNRPAKRKFSKLFEKLLKQRMQPNEYRHPLLCQLARAYNERLAKAAWSGDAQ
jgi:hypothetical protein